MMTDTRAISKPDETGKSKILSNNSLKMRTLSDYVCLGFCGDRDIAAPIAFGINENRNHFLEDCSRLLQGKIKTTAIGEYPVHFILFGRLCDANKNELRLISLSSYNDFKPDTHSPTEHSPAYIIALPTIDKVTREQQEKRIIDIILSHKDINELRSNLITYIKEISETEMSKRDIGNRNVY